MTWLRRLAVALFVWRSSLHRPRCCPPGGCETARFWRAYADRANADADRFASQLTALGHQPSRLVDGHQARLGHETFRP